MKLFVLLCLLILPLQQQSKPEKVALIFGPEPQRIEFMETAGAERLYAALEAKRVAGTNTAEDDRLHAALTQALGTISEPETAPHVNSVRERLDWEIRRGVSKPTQKPVCRYRGDLDCWRLN